MSIKDLMANWEEALAVALSQPAHQEMHDDALTDVADRRIARIRSNVHAGIHGGGGQIPVVLMYGFGSVMPVGC